MCESYELVMVGGNLEGELLIAAEIGIAHKVEMVLVFTWLWSRKLQFDFSFVLESQPLYCHQTTFQNRMISVNC